MNIIYLLVPMSFVLVAIILWVFFWAVRNDQFNDLEGPAYRALFDDDSPDLEKVQKVTKKETQER